MVGFTQHAGKIFEKHFPGASITFFEDAMVKVGREKTVLNSSSRSPTHHKHLYIIYYYYIILYPHNSHFLAQNAIWRFVNEGNNITFTTLSKCKTTTFRIIMKLLVKKYSQLPKLIFSCYLLLYEEKGREGEAP